jgi:hypothetical protein
MSRGKYFGPISQKGPKSFRIFSKKGRKATNLVSIRMSLIINPCGENEWLNRFYILATVGGMIHLKRSFYITPIFGDILLYCSDHRLQTEWQRPLSGVHSIMREKLTQACEGGDARPPPFTISTITCKVAVYAPAKRTDTLPLFNLYPTLMYSVVRTTGHKNLGTDQSSN